MSFLVCFALNIMGSQVTDGFGDPKEPSKKHSQTPRFLGGSQGDTLGGTCDQRMWEFLLQTYGWKMLAIWLFFLSKPDGLMQLRLW